MSTYQVVVGNIGTVHSGENEKGALSVFREYVRQSKAGYGRASGEDVTLFRGDVIMRECAPKPKFPTIKELADLLKALKKNIDDDYRATDDPEDDTPGMCVTVGCDPQDGSWSYQTGDNSYTGGAYGYAYWGIGYLYRRSNSREVAREIIDDIADQYWSAR